MGPTVVFEPAVRIPVPIGLVGKTPLPVGVAVGPPLPSLRGYRYGVSEWLAHRGPINAGKATKFPSANWA